MFVYAFGLAVRKTPVYNTTAYDRFLGMSSSCRAYNRNGKRNTYGHSSLLVVLFISRAIKADRKAEIEIGNNK